VGYRHAKMTTAQLFMHTFDDIVFLDFSNDDQLSFSNLLLSRLAGAFSSYGINALHLY
jgi:hypothetical protein